jgi:hypothetical protein
MFNYLAQNYKIIIAVITVALAFVGYVPYFRDILKGKTTPHLFTWLVWTLAVGISAALQIYGGAKSGAWTTVAVTIICLGVLTLSIKKGTKNIKKVDIIFLVLALLSLFFWLVIDKPIWSAILIVATDLLGFAPTIRKTWNDPHSETLSMYKITGIRHALSIVALAQYNILTLLYPIAWTVANVLFSVMLIIRRKSHKIF